MWESRCLVEGIALNLLSVRCMYVALIVMAAVFSVGWYKIAM